MIRQGVCQRCQQPLVSGDRGAIPDFCPSCRKVGYYVRYHGYEPPSKTDVVHRGRPFGDHGRGPNAGRKDSERAFALTLRQQGMSYKQISECVGVSRQRVQQWLRPSSIERASVVGSANGRCQSCGEPVGVSGHVHHQRQNATDYNSLSNLQLLCVSCHMKTNRQHFPLYECCQCGKHFESRSPKLYCSNKCVGDAGRIPVTCEVCGRVFRRAKCLVIRVINTPKYHGHITCSRSCRSHFIWEGHKYLKTGEPGDIKALT
jgi:hypothetical protein